MRRLACGLLVSALAGGEERPPDPPKIAAADVNAAVARGVAWLRGEQEPTGGFGGPGETALALLALRHSGVPAADPACTRAAKRLERQLPDGSVYGAALGVLALAEQDPAAHRKEIERLVADLARGQCRNGQWTYAYRGTARKSAGDNSNSQLAILALAVARARRFAVPDETFARLDAFLVGSQNDDGGFGYSDNQRARSYGSMTAGGAMMLALCAPGGREAGGKRAETRRALSWLAREFDPATNRGAAIAFGKAKGRRSDNFWKHYWLWSLERACGAAGAAEIDGVDWYALGARHLLDTQRRDGQWRDPENELLATCFALLFLGRSTERAFTPRPGDRATTPGGG
jgi:hypothetical protein